MAIRDKIYYWKSDRPHTDSNLQRNNRINTSILENQLQDYLKTFFHGKEFVLKPANGQGNHITYTALCNDEMYFIRLENGPELDDYMDVESNILQRLRELFIPCPRIYLSDSTRHKVPFAIQIMEYLSYPSLNTLNPDDEKATKLAETIGVNIARWQQIPTEKFGLFDPAKLALENKLCGYHETYEQYFFLNFESHLTYLESAGFLKTDKVKEIRKIVDENASLLQLEDGCLVHKDIAFWNILSDTEQIRAFIDWDDAIAGDPVDDLSLLGCFHSGSFVKGAIEGYRTASATFPSQFERRFWLHLLRNMIFKSVIRVRGKYFDITDKFFLDIPGRDLRSYTLDRINTACEGLKGNKTISDL